VSHPAPELLVPYALGTPDAATARHVDACATCRTEVEQLQEAAGMLRALGGLERRVETPDCLDELQIADFVEGRLAPEARAQAVTHLLACPRCRALVRATSSLASGAAVTVQAPMRTWRRWILPLGAAAAAAVLVLMFLPRHGAYAPTPNVDEPGFIRTDAPVPIAPRATVALVDRLVWSSVPHAERYRLRLYDAKGSVLWRLETTDTVGLLPSSVVLAPGVSYFWRVEAQTESRRWSASDSVEFRVARRSRQ
jgi:hypothetical protein